MGAPMPNVSIVPEGWKVEPLSSCVDVLDSRRKPVNWKERESRIGPIPYYGATGQVGWIDDFLFDEELVLLGEDGAPFLDKSKPIAYVIDGKSWVNNHAHVLRARSEVTSNRYIKHYLDSLDFSGYVQGSTRDKLTQRAMNSIPVSLAPRPLQEKLVRVIDAAGAKRSSAKAHLTSARRTIERFRQSVFVAACTGRLTAEWRDAYIGSDNARDALKAFLTQRRYQPRGKKAEAFELHELPELPAGWVWTDLDSLAADIPNALKAGPFGSSLTKAMYTSSGYKVYGQEQVIRGDAYFDTYFISEPKYRELESCAVQPGDVLVSLVGTIGKVLVLPRDCQPGIINPRLIKLSLNNELMTPGFVHLVLSSPLSHAYYQRSSQGSTMEILNVAILRGVAIPLPPIAEQAEIVRRVNALLSLADRLKTRIDAASRRIDRSSQAVLAKAFRGDLIGALDGES